MIDICEYDAQYKIVEERLCPEHRQDVTMRCRTCVRSICVECLDDFTACDGTYLSVYCSIFLFSNYVLVLQL